MLEKDGITILERIQNSVFRCKVKDYAIAKEHSLVDKIDLYAVEIFITQKTKILTDDTLIPFDILIHHVFDLPVVVAKLKTFIQDFDYRDNNRKIRIHLLYPQQKFILEQIMEFPEIEKIEEYVLPSVGI